MVKNISVENFNSGVFCQSQKKSHSTFFYVDIFQGLLHNLSIYLMTQKDFFVSNAYLLWRNICSRKCSNSQLNRLHFFEGIKRNFVRNRVESFDKNLCDKKFWMLSGSKGWENELGKVCYGMGFFLADSGKEQRLRIDLLLIYHLMIDSCLAFSIFLFLDLLMESSRIVLTN